MTTTTTTTTPPPPAASRAMQAHRGRVVREIVSSERVYHGLLLDFLHCYGAALQAELEEASSDFMSRSALVGLLSNLDQISNVSNLLLADLTRVVASCKEAVPSMTEEALILDAHAAIGEVFLHSSSLLKLYGLYAENHANARRDIRAMTASPVFRAFWDRVETEAMLGRGPPGSDVPPRAPSTSATLDGYLILPIQRVPRYLLLLRELVKCTPADWTLESNSLARAVDSVEAAAKFMNESICRAEQLDVLRDIQSKFIGTTVDFVGGVGPAGYRALLFQGELMRVTRKGAHRLYYFHLLNDALVYSRQVSGGFRFHRALTLTGSCNVADAPPPGPSLALYDAYTSMSNDPLAAMGGSGAPNPPLSRATLLKRSASNLLSLSGVLASGDAASGAADTPPPSSSTTSRAFRIDTPEKSFVVYAASLELKHKWMEMIASAIRDAAKWDKTPTPATATTTTTVTPAAAAPPTTTGGASSPADSVCHMCHTQLRLFRRRTRCERCGILVCGECGDNCRVTQRTGGSGAGSNGGGLPSVRHLALRQICSVCALEMDSTPITSHVDEFRLKLWVEDVQSLVSHRKGHSFLDPQGAAQALSTNPNRKRHADAEEALKRLYFTLSFSPDSGDTVEERGPSNAGQLGQDGAFLLPLGSPANPTGLSKLILHVHILGHCGEIGSLTIDPADIIAQQEVARNQPYSRFFVMATRRTNQTAVSTLAVTLVQPRHRNALHKELSQKERSALRIGLRIGFELRVPPALWGLHANSSTSTPPTTSSDLASRIKVFSNVDDPTCSVGGSLDSSDAVTDVAHFNPSLLGEYERRVMGNPTTWGVRLTDIMYSDCLARFGVMAKLDATRFADTQVSILNRFHAFHGKPVVARLLEDGDARAPTPTPAVGGGSTPTTTRRPSKNVQVSQHAMQALLASAAAAATPPPSTPITAVLPSRVCEEEEEDEDDEDTAAAAEDRKAILQDLLETERAYVSQLEVLDQVYAARLLQVSQGASVKLAVERNTGDAWAAKMGLKPQPNTLAQGVGSTSSSWSPTKLLRRVASKPGTATSPLKGAFTNSFRKSFAEAGGFNFSGGGGESPSGGHGAGGAGDGDASTEEDKEEERVMQILNRPNVKVLLQSVRQIRTVNVEFLTALEAAHAGGANVGDVIERFSSVMNVYSSYATNHVSVLDDLCPPVVHFAGERDASARGGGAHGNPTSPHQNRRQSLSKKLVGSLTSAAVVASSSSSSSGYPPSLKALLDACEADPRASQHPLGALDLRTLLNAPVERLETYRSMLSALLMCTPRTHSDWELFRVSIGRIVELNLVVGRALRRKDNFDKIKEIEAVVEGWPAWFNLHTGGRWLVREGYLVEKTDGDVHRTRYLWLFSDVLVMAIRKSNSMVSRMAFRFGGGGGAGGEPRAKFKFLRLVKIEDLSICDLPRGAGGSAGQVLGDPMFAFCVPKVGVLLVPNNPTDCVSRTGPCPVENARLTMAPPKHSIETKESVKGRQLVVYEKSAVKNAWVEDLLLCIEMFRRGEHFDSEDVVHLQQAAAAERSQLRASMMRRKLMEEDRVAAVAAATTGGENVAENSNKEQEDNDVVEDVTEDSSEEEEEEERTSSSRSSLSNDVPQQQAPPTQPRFGGGAVSFVEALKRQQQQMLVGRNENSRRTEEEKEEEPPSPKPLMPQADGGQRRRTVLGGGGR